MYAKHQATETLSLHLCYLVAIPFGLNRFQMGSQNLYQVGPYDRYKWPGVITSPIGVSYNSNPTYL